MAIALVLTTRILWRQHRMHKNQRNIGSLRRAQGVRTTKVAKEIQDDSATDMQTYHAEDDSRPAPLEMPRSSQEFWHPTLKNNNTHQWDMQLPLIRKQHLNTAEDLDNNGSLKSGSSNGIPTNHNYRSINPEDICSPKKFERLTTTVWTRKAEMQRSASRVTMGKWRPKKSKDFEVSREKKASQVKKYHKMHILIA